MLVKCADEIELKNQLEIKIKLHNKKHITIQLLYFKIAELVRFGSQTNQTISFDFLSYSLNKRRRVLDK